MKISDLVGFDKKKGSLVLGSHKLDGTERNDMQAAQVSSYRRDFDAILAGLSDMSPEEHRAFASTILEPIMQLAPYAEIYDMFYQLVNYGETEDSLVAVEDLFAIAWETHQDGAARYVRAGYSFARPSYTTFDTAIDVSWAQARKTGWNFFARQLMYAAWALAKKRDEKAKNVWEAALLPSHVVTISGGVLTKAAVDTIVKGSADIGFPVTQALANPGTLADMTDFVWPQGVFLPAPRVEQLITNLHLTNYAGIGWVVNPYVETNRIRFSGPPNMVGWHMTKGNVRNTSAVDIDNKRDKYLIEDQEHGWYIGSALTLWEIRINP